MISDAAFWSLTAALAVGTFLIRFSFLGIFGRRTLPPWALLHLKYVGVAVFPALVAPLVLWPEATGGTPDPARLIAALAALVAGLRISVVAAILAGMGTLYLIEAAARLL
ncbi:AzlD domain-containing protein [Rhodovulum kholense]|uniref:Branched-subunit amino acid transport protein n=1 Tax=Rhodovulum kholense TaxID=453584 RepID=A0A8E3AS96_9RHOB|nr:AzlD domain-containing protein [Rhodovulum kholense]PTW51979.1 branched-subunit amino acid transport protein [Rhodovulum kholense]